MGNAVSLNPLQTREDVVRAASALTLDTVYLLAGKDEEEAEHA